MSQRKLWRQFSLGALSHHEERATERKRTVVWLIYFGLRKLVRALLLLCAECLNFPFLEPFQCLQAASRSTNTYEHIETYAQIQHVNVQYSQNIKLGFNDLYQKKTNICVICEQQKISSIFIIHLKD